MIYKQQQQSHQALECLQMISEAPPAPLTRADVWFLIGEIQETMEPPAPSFAKQAYEHVLRLLQADYDPKVAKAYRQLEQQGIITTRPGTGTFIANLDSNLSSSVKKKLLCTEMEHVVVDAYHMQIAKPAIKKWFDETVERFKLPE